MRVRYPWCKNKGIHGLFIAIREGDENEPRPGIMFTSIKPVMRKYNGKDQFYTNLAALFLKTCTANDVEIKK